MLQNYITLDYDFLRTCFTTSPFYFLKTIFRGKKNIGNQNYPFNNQGNKPNNRKNNDLVNEFIRFPEVLVIGPDGESLGKMGKNQALKKAEEFNLDLVCVAPQAKPPVCKILNYGKYRYESQKKAKEAKKNQKVIEVKEIQLTPNIGEHDLQTKAKNAIKFLEDGNKLKVGVRFKGRELSHVEIGQEQLDKFFDLVKDYAVIEKKANLEGRWLTEYLASKVKK